MKQSLHKGTIDNITCILICFNNLKNILQHRFSDAALIKREYSPLKEKVSIFNIDAIRKRIFEFAEKDIELKKNENLNFFHLAFSETLRENKPKTSSEALKSKHGLNPCLMQFTNNSLNVYSEGTEENFNTEESDKRKLSIKIVTQKKLSLNTYTNKDLNNKNNSNLPSFRLSQQRINRLSKNNIEIDSLSTPIGHNTKFYFFNNNVKKNVNNPSLNKNLSYNSNNVKMFNSNKNEKLKIESASNLSNFRNFYSTKNLNSNSKEDSRNNNLVLNKKISINTSNNFFSKNVKVKALPSISITNTKRNSSEKFNIYKFTKTGYQNFSSFSPVSNKFKNSKNNINTVNLNFQNVDRSSFSNKNLALKNNC